MKGLSFHLPFIMLLAPHHVTEPAATTMDGQFGRKAAEHLAHSCPEMDGLIELESPEFERGAESLSARPPAGKLTRLATQVD
jgi:hypothetical protein